MKKPDLILELKAIENHMKYQDIVINELSEIIRKQQAIIKKLKSENKILKREGIGE